MLSLTSPYQERGIVNKLEDLTRIKSQHITMAIINTGFGA